MVGARRAPTIYDLDRVGAPLPAVTVTMLDGTPLPIQSLRGRPTYVFLFASWCEPCVLELPWMKAAYATYGNRVRFLGVDVLEDHAAAVAFTAKEALPFPVAYVDTATLDQSVDLYARQDGGPKYQLPTDFVVDARGIVRGAWHGLPVDAGANPIDVIPQHIDTLLALTR